jgi:hypothetical protein
MALSWDPHFSLLLFKNWRMSLSPSFNSLQTLKAQRSPPIGPEMQLGNQNHCLHALQQ